MSNVSKTMSCQRHGNEIKNNIKRRQMELVDFNLNICLPRWWLELHLTRKTTWIKKLLQNVNTMVVPPPEKIV